MKTQISRLTSQVRYVIAASAAASVVSVSPVIAQEAADDSADFEKIAIVGTRAAPRSIGDSAVPYETPLYFWACQVILVMIGLTI